MVWFHVNNFLYFTYFHQFPQILFLSLFLSHSFPFFPFHNVTSFLRIFSFPLYVHPIPSLSFSQTYFPIPSFPSTLAPSSLSHPFITKYPFQLPFRFSSSIIHSSDTTLPSSPLPLSTPPFPAFLLPLPPIPFPSCLPYPAHIQFAQK